MFYWEDEIFGPPRKGEYDHTQLPIAATFVALAILTFFGAYLWGRR